MNPDQNQDPNQYSIDYLNQIAPQSQGSGMDNKKFFLLVGGGLLVAIVAGILVFSSGGSGGPKQNMQTLAARLQTLQTVTDDSQKNIKSGALRGINSNLSIFLTNANRDIAEPLAKNGIDIKKLDEKIVAKESGAKLIEVLDEARLNAVFDRTYSREMSYQLETVTALMNDIYAKSNSASLKEFLKNTDSNLTPLKQQLSDFNNTTE